ncbi:hypothetical protein ACIA8K_26460 [Catenuloplanes sp. NPDC051500]|uniref:hypothetical protein n=1 Tax=Catenuloplanes sp. NPDC051500 TaxID=3363959 RepID=UPI00378EFCDD
MTDDNDAYLSNDEDSANKYAGQVIDYGWDSVIPGAGGGKTLYEGITEGDKADIIAGAGDLLGTGISFAVDPLNWLIAAGLTFVVDFFQPLEDLLSLVTGNAERMEPHAKQWEEIGKALAPLAASIRQAADDALIEWKGKDADAAKKLFHDFADAVEATGTEAGSIGQLLMIFSKIMAAAQALIIGIIASIVEWALIEWAIAMSLAVPTAGASMAAAATATTYTTASGFSRAVQIVDRIVSVLWKMRAVLEKALPAILKAQVGKGVVQFSGASATMSTLARIGGDVAGDVWTWVGPGAQTGAETGKAATADPPKKTDAEIDAILDTAT